MSCFGSHVSVAGGLDRGIERAVAVQCDCVQIFTKNNNRWAAKPLEPADVARWQVALDASSIKHPIAHASYLINLAAPDDALFRKSIDAMVDEMQRAMRLGLEGVVVHPGAFTTTDEETGLRRIVDGVTTVLGELVAASESLTAAPCRLLLENTAGQGSCLGHSLDQLAFLFDGIAKACRDTHPGGLSDHLGLCLDTCHAFAAGVDWRDAVATRDFTAELRQRLPQNCLRAIHLNDSKKGLGSRVDRHDHIGRGEIGEAAFARLLNDEFFSVIPGYLETEKGIDDESGEDWDAINLRTLRRLVS